MTKNELFVKLAAVIATIDEVEEAPEVSMYLALGMDLDLWYMIKNILIVAGLAKANNNHTMSITPAGHEMALKIKAAVKAN